MRSRPVEMSGACLLSAGAGGALAAGFPRGAAACLGLALVCLLLAGLRRLERSYRVTSERVVLRRGFLARRVIEIELREARGLTLSQSLSEGLLGIGTVDISSSTGGEAVSFAGISSPEAVKETIRRARLAAGAADRGMTRGSVTEPFGEGMPPPRAVGKRPASEAPGATDG